MDESENMVALKKAYAEIILNTAKDAAARVIASERRALRVQHDLNATKEESLRMLLRLKGMLDSRTNEADIACISQRRKIEELEAQLGEAEDKILELRVELGNTTDELEKQKKNELQLQDASNNETPQNHLNILERIVPYSSDSDLETAIPSEKTEKGCLGATEESGQLGFSHLQKYYPHGSDIASIIMGSGETELSRNGCTQRVRAFERQQLGGTLSSNRLKAKESERKCIVKCCQPPSADSDSNLRVTEDNAKLGEQEKLKCSDSKYEGGIVLGKKKRSMTKRKHRLRTSDEHYPNKVRTRSSGKTEKATKDNGVVDVTVRISQQPLTGKESQLRRYTFQRKSKKETTLNCPDEDTSLEEIKVKRCANETDEGLEESSRDIRQLAQVASQLISLSGKKRW